MLVKLGVSVKGLKSQGRVYHSVQRFSVCRRNRDTLKVGFGLWPSLTLSAGHLSRSVHPLPWECYNWHRISPSFIHQGKSTQTVLGMAPNKSCLLVFVPLRMMSLSVLPSRDGIISSPCKSDLVTCFDQCCQSDTVWHLWVRHLRTCTFRGYPLAIPITKMDYGMRKNHLERALDRWVRPSQTHQAQFTCEVMTFTWGIPGKTSRITTQRSSTTQRIMRNNKSLLKVFGKFATCKGYLA